MKTPVIDPGWWRAGQWNGRPIRDILADRDIEAVFQFLRRQGVARTRLAAVTGLSETRIRQIAQGRQRVCSYEVLERIADGLTIPRHYLGLGYAADEPMPQGPALADEADTPSSLRYPGIPRVGLCEKDLGVRAWLGWSAVVWDGVCGSGCCRLGGWFVGF